MAVNKVVLGEDTLIDLTGDTVSADKLAKGTTAHDMAGEPIVGTMEAGGGKVYTFTDGLTETNGTVKWDLSDRIFKRKYQYGDYGGISIGWKDASSQLQPTRKGSLVLGVSYGGSIAATTSGTMVVGYASNGTIKNTGIGSIMSIRNSQGSANNYGYGNIVFGNVDYIGKIEAEENTKGALCGGISDEQNSLTNTGKISTNGQGTLTVGLGVQNKGWGSTVLGMCNIVSSTGTYNTRGDYAFIYGNGTSNTSRSNAYTLDWQGNGTFAGTVSSSTGADYAEYFEWKDGNPNNEDRVGYIVTLDGDKIVKANSGDDVLGICSGTAMVLGDSAEWNWSKRYLTDDFGRIIYEDYDVDYKEDNGEITKRHVHAPKENPEYDSSQPYAKRADRPEWQIVGMMGKIYVRDDGTCVVNGYADVKDGIATKANGKTSMRVMERVTDNIIRVLMK